MSSTAPKTHTARKQHWCSLCNLPIEPGERYTAWRWFEARDACTIRVHLPCDDLRVEHEVYE